MTTTTQPEHTMDIHTLRFLRTIHEALGAYLDAFKEPEAPTIEPEVEVEEAHEDEEQTTLFPKPKRDNHGAALKRVRETHPDFFTRVPMTAYWILRRGMGPTAREIADEMAGGPGKADPGKSITILICAVLRESGWVKDNEHHWTPGEDR